MPVEHADLLIIGAGSGGLTLASGASQMGAKVILLERDEMGGDCLNVGCVPSKSLLSAAKAGIAHKKAEKMGVRSPVALSPASFPETMKHVQRVIASIAPHDSQERFEGLGVRVIREEGRFTSPRIVRAGEYEISARRIVIATGSRPSIPPISGIETVPYLTNETIWRLDELPENLLILGAGPIGLEMAQAFSRLGSHVTILEAMNEAIPKAEPETRQILLEHLQQEGISIRTGVKISEAKKADNLITLTDEQGQKYCGTHMLIAAGRKPNIESLDLGAAGIRHTHRGVDVDHRLRSTNKRVYAIGDVAGGPQFTHVAGHHGAQLIRSLVLGLPGAPRMDHIPSVIYTDPEIAQIGLSEKEAFVQFGSRIGVISVPFSGNDRAQAVGETEGMLKLIHLKERILGVSIIGDHAGELIAFWALAISAKLRLRDVSSTVLPYPTLSEIHKRASGAYFSPKLFDNPYVKRLVGLVQRYMP